VHIDQKIHLKNGKNKFIAAANFHSALKKIKKRKMKTSVDEHLKM